MSNIRVTPHVGVLPVEWAARYVAVSDLVSLTAWGRQHHFTAQRVANWRLRFHETFPVALYDQGHCKVFLLSELEAWLQERREQYCP